MAHEQPSTLARYLFVAYVLLVVYASLHPFSGWRDRGLPPFAFVAAPFTRPMPVFDVVVNVIGYVPLGFLAALAAVAGTRALRLEEGLLRLRERFMLPGRRIDLGLVLIGLWLLSQLNPETLLFGTGDLRELFRAPSGKLYPAEVFVRVEAGVACGNVFAAGLLFFCLCSPGQPVRVLAVALVAAALAVRCFAFGLLIGSQAVLDWVTPGALYGTASGIALLLVAAGFPRTVQMALAGLALLAATAIVNLSPANPYLTATLSLWQQGHYLNLNGVTRVVSAACPFAAMFYLVLLATAHERTRI